MKRFRRRMTHTFSTQRMNSDSGLSDVAETLKESDIYKNGSCHLGILARTTRRLSFSTSKLSDVCSNNSPVCADLPLFVYNLLLK